MARSPISSFYSPARALNIILGTLSAAKLIEHAYHLGFGPTLQIVLDYFERLAAVVFSPSEPLIKEALANLRDLIGWDAQLYPHWKHIFVLMMIYFTARFRAFWSIGEYASAILLLIVGLVVAIAASVAAGTVPIIPGADKVVMSNMLMAVYPVAGAMIFDLAEITRASISRHEVMAARLDRPDLTRSECFFFLARKVAIRFAFASLLLLIGTQASSVPILRDMPSPGITILGLLIVNLSFYWLYQGAQSALRTMRYENIDPTLRNFVVQFFELTSTRVGLLILWTICSVLSLIALSAMLGLLGL